MRSHRFHLLPGFKLSLGITTTMLGLMVLLPLSTLLLRLTTLSFDAFLSRAFSPRALAAYALSILTALIAALIVTLIGALLAWVLTRYALPGKRLLDALIDLPFALPTAVAGIALTNLYGPHGLVGRALASVGVQLAYTRAGIVLALVFVGLPFVVRTLQPVLETLDPAFEEAAASLGATRLQTLRLVLLPQLVPGLVTGFALALARGLGEYGSVIFIAGNMPMHTEIAPLLVVIRLEEFDYDGAAAISSVMLLASFLLMCFIHLTSHHLTPHLTDSAS